MNAIHARPVFLLVLIALAGLTFAAPADAQGVECRSRDFGYRECAVSWPRSELVRQLSESQCIEGRTWGQRGDRLWVDRGCAGTFAPARHGGGPGGGWGDARGEVECRSDNYRYAECQVGWRGAQLVRRTSTTVCVEGQNWGFRRGSIWVDKGCKAVFVEGQGHGGGWGGGPGGPGGERIECNSERNRYKACPVGNWRGARLVRQTSNAACVEGRTWGLQRGTLWVDEGCAGVFEASRHGGGSGGPGGPGGPGGAATLTCNSVNHGYRECTAPGWRDARLLRQTSNAACVEDRTWGLRRGVLWVDNGCAGEFTRTR